MRNKINIMNRRQDITDEELERFKNFDSLLNQHYRILNEKKPVSWKLITPAALLLGLMAAYWWMNREPELQTNKTLTSDSVTQAETERDTMDAGLESQNADQKKETRKAETKKSVPDKIVHGNHPVNEPKDSVVIPSEPVAPVQKDSQTAPEKTETIYIQAEPVNGYDSLYAYFSKELIYPQAAVKDSIEGVLIVKFLINKGGKAEKVETSGTLGILFDREAVRLIENMPLWRPATVNGKPITSKLSIPLTFQIRNKK